MLVVAGLNFAFDAVGNFGDEAAKNQYNHEEQNDYRLDGSRIIPDARVEHPTLHYNHLLHADQMIWVYFCDTPTQTKSKANSQKTRAYQLFNTKELSIM